MAKKLLLIFLAGVFLIAFQPAKATDVETLNQEIAGYEAQVKKLQSQANTLSNQIAQFNAQIKLTELKINQTQERITLLGGRIDQLETSLQSLTKAFSTRAVATYKMARTGESLFMVLSSTDLNDVVSKYHYLQKIQAADHGLLVRLQGAQNTYKTDKTEQEKLEAQLETQKKSLATQKLAKDQLLLITRNDERKYQELLKKARAELEAIQSIIAGKGTETEVKKVGEMERIASVIPGSSACSSGGHLHFEVVKDKGHQNPAGFLQPKSVIWNNEPDGPFGFGGSWQWPINDPVRITQGYGMTYYANNLKYYGGSPHTGIDMVNTADYTVKAVKPGTLFRGGIGCGGGTLRYVHVRQDDGYDTYYLHVNY